MLHTGDVAYGGLCDRVRQGIHTSEDIYTLNSRLYDTLPNKEYFDDALWLISRKKEVDKFNIKKFKTLKTEKITIKASDTYANSSDLGKKVDPKVLYSKIEKCGGMLNEIQLAVGARVMLRRNTNVSKGLVSGSMGTVEGFIWPSLARKQKKTGQLPEAVKVRFDDDKIALAMPELATKDGCIKVEPTRVLFQAKKGKTISRSMLPLILCWAVTIHKIQGATLTKAVVDLDCFGNALEYVALSRIKTLEGLAVSRIKISRFISNTIVSKCSLKELGLNFRSIA